MKKRLKYELPAAVALSISDIEEKSKNTTGGKTKTRRTISFLGSARGRQRLAMSAVALLTGAAHADITVGQAQAMAEHSAGQMANFMAGILGACASTYPDTRSDVVKAMRAMAGKSFGEDEAIRIVTSVGQCMSNKAAPTKSQCRDLAAKLQSGNFDPDDPQFSPMMMNSLEMLEPCRRKKNSN